MFRTAYAICVLIALGGLVPVGPAAAGELTQILSREHPSFDVSKCRMDVGDDGRVYFSHGEYVLRMRPDGSEKAGAKTTYALNRVTANAEGTIATAHGHFAHAVQLWRPNFEPLAKVDDFLNDDSVGYLSPGDLTTDGVGGFFALDANRERIVRIDRDGKLVDAVSLSATGEKFVQKLAHVRAWTPGKRLYVVCPSGEIACVGFDGKLGWKKPGFAAGDPWSGFATGCDVDAEGNFRWLRGGSLEIEGYSPEGEPLPKFKLDLATTLPRVSHLCLAGDQWLVKGVDDSELFSAYDAKTGAKLRSVKADIDKLSVSLDKDKWTAGEPVELKIDFASSLPTDAAVWRAWLSPWNVSLPEELPIVDGRITPPADRCGLFRLRVCSDVGGRRSAHFVDTAVSIVPKDVVGVVSVWTIDQRAHFRAEEAIRVVVHARGPQATRPRSVRLTTRPARSTNRDPGGTLKNLEVEVALDDQGRGETTIAPTMLDSEGSVLLSAAPPEGWAATQTLLVRRKVKSESASKGQAPFRIVQHGDYTAALPSGGLYDATDEVESHIQRARRLGVNLFVDRLGDGSLTHSEVLRDLRDEALEARLKNDPAGVAPELAQLAGPYRQAIGIYGTIGIEQRAIGLYMDAGVPLGTLYDRRPPEQMIDTIRKTEAALADYPAFGGWSFAANWWLEKLGPAAATDAEREEYAAALKKAETDGEWSEILDRVGDRILSQRATAGETLRKGLDEAERSRVVALTGPYRADGSHPPIDFSNADEIDLQYQAEQIQPPQVAPHEVDYYRRPGKPSWGHPEIWNDDGTGGMSLAAMLQFPMRGATGTGWCGSMPHERPRPDHPRSGVYGVPSVLRRQNEILKTHGAWLNQLTPESHVAIVVSSRMRKIDFTYSKIGARYFDRLYEAYQACLFARHPATFAFVEDLRPETFDRFQSIVVAGQTVPLEPALAQALAAAKAAGKPIFRDGTCRPGCVEGFAELPVSFNRMDQDTAAWQDDYAHQRIVGYFQEHAAAISQALDSAGPPVAVVDRSDVVVASSQAARGKLYWIVNAGVRSEEPGVVWPIANYFSHRPPVVARVKLPGTEPVIDLTTGAKLERDASGAVLVELRTTPVRMLSVGVPDADRPKPDQTSPGGFGWRLRKLVASPDGKTLFATGFDAVDNVIALDAKTLQVKWQGQVGDHYAYAPVATNNELFVEGDEKGTPHVRTLFRIDADGRVTGRFAAFHVAQRAKVWAFGGLPETSEDASFAVAPDGSWIASSGSLGWLVWDRDGKELAREDVAPDAPRTIRRLLALSNKQLVVFDATAAVATIRSPSTQSGKRTLTLASSGKVVQVWAAADQRTFAALVDADGGRLIVVRDSAIVASIPGAVDDLVFAPDGNWLALVTGRRLAVHRADGALRWTWTSFDQLHHPTISADGREIAVGEELGRCVRFDATGTKQKDPIDAGALPCPAWTEPGGWTVGTWMGSVSRLDRGTGAPTKPTLLPVVRAPRIAGRANPPPVDAVARGRINSLPTPLPIDDNLLRETPSLIGFWCVPKTHGDPRPTPNDVKLLFDGQEVAPPKPWLDWYDVSMVDSGWRAKLSLQVDTFRTQLRVEAITFREDPKHPESWLRDVRVQWWDPLAEVWHDGPRLLSDAAIHSHKIDPPIEATKLRFVSSGGGPWPIGNVRLTELQLHGQALGASHPDRLAMRDEAVLFDERDNEAANLWSPEGALEVRAGDAFSGGKSLALKAAGQAFPQWIPPFGHALPMWDFEIAENPEPGQYRWLEFAWKADAGATGTSLRIGAEFPTPALQVTAGESSFDETSAMTKKVAAAPPKEWTTVRVDLWELVKERPQRIRSLLIGSKGGGAQFDKIRLDRGPSP